MEIWRAEIFLLDPTVEEMETFVEYLENKRWAHGIVSYNNPGYKGDHFPRIHNTYGQKWGGRAHIDTGYTGEFGSVHLMLGRYAAPFFIEFIRNLRNEKVEE